MKPNLNENEKTVINFLKAIEGGSTSDLQKFYHPDVEQIEYPNAVVKNTVVRKIHDLNKASAQGTKILEKQEYEVRNLYALDNVVILEAIWRGTLAVPMGSIPAGNQMVAYFAQFYEFQDGKIIKQRNYDCFEPFN